MLEAEKAAASAGKGKNMVELLDLVRADKKLSTAARWEDGNKIRDGIMVRAPEEMIKYGSQWKVAPDELTNKNAEMTNAAGKSTTILHLCDCSCSNQLQSTTLEERSTLQNKSNSTSTTCIASIAPSSTTLS